MFYKIASLIALASLLIGCGNPNSGGFFAGSLGLGDGRLIVVTNDATANSQNQSVNVYSLAGQFLYRLFDYGSVGDAPKGITALSPFSFLVVLDGTDRVEWLDIYGNRRNFALNAQLAGTLYQSVRDSAGNLYVIEGNAIEKFDAAGNRSTGSSANAFIVTTIGACTLATPRSLRFNANGQLVVVNSTGVVLIYDVATTPNCVNSVALANTPVTFISHSNGNLYIGRQTSDAIVQTNAVAASAVDITTDTTIIDNPSAMVEMPDGTILVASDGLNSIERITISGARVGNSSFILDSNTTSVSEMIIVRDR